MSFVITSSANYAFLINKSGRFSDTIIMLINTFHVASDNLKLKLKFIVFWDVLPCSQANVDRRFRGAYCFHQ
jgi:hypothetical protein